MKNYILILMMALNSSLLYSQITITEIEKKNVERITMRPPAYDSLKSWEDHEKLSDYKQYVGIRIYCLAIEPTCMISKTPNIFPVDQKFGAYKYDGYGSAAKRLDYKNIMTFKYKPKHISSSGLMAGEDNPIVKTDIEQISDKYYTILNVLYGDTLKVLLKNFYRTLENSSNLRNSNTFIDREEIKYYRDLSADAYIYVLRNDIDGDTLFCSLSHENFILVPYFVKQKQLYEKQNIIYDDEKNSSGDYTWKEIKKADIRYPIKSEDKYGKEISTYKLVNIVPGSKWFCSEVTILKPFNQIIYILKNNQEEQITLSLKSLSSGFIKEEDYNKREMEKKLQSQQLLAKQKKEELIKKENERLVYELERKDCIAKFGLENCELIVQGNVKIGFSKEMCEKAWGKPFDIYKTTTANGTYEDWYFGWKYSLHFSNGLLYKIEN